MHDTILKADRSGRLRFSPEQRLALLHAYQTSGLSAPSIRRPARCEVSDLGHLDPKEQADGCTQAKEALVHRCGSDHRPRSSGRAVDGRIDIVALYQMYIVDDRAIFAYGHAN